MKTKTKLQVFTLSLAIMLSLLTLCAMSGRSQVAAEELSAGHEIETVSASEESPLGIISSLSINIGAESGQVYATVRNDFTLFPSKIQVYVQLYSSLTYQNSYQNMTLESSKYIADLDMGKSITTYAPINAVKRYWQARLYFKMDNNSWSEKLTKIWLVEVDGTATSV